jgi:hypothetical protein
MNNSPHPRILGQNNRIPYILFCTFDEVKNENEKLQNKIIYEINAWLYCFHNALATMPVSSRFPLTMPTNYNPIDWELTVY